MKSALLYLSTSEGFKNFLTRFKSFNSVTQRFVAGEEIAEAVEAIKQLNSKQISATFDHLGESISSEAETLEEVRRIYDTHKSVAVDTHNGLERVPGDGIILGKRITRDKKVPEAIECDLLHEPPQQAADTILLKGVPHVQASDFIVHA